MKIIHLADLHIGKRLFGYSLIEDQEYVFREMIEPIEKFSPDCILIAGDVFDRSVPSEEAMTLYERFISKLAGIAPVYMVSGNHDSGIRLGLFKDFLSQKNVHICGKIETELKPEVLDLGDERAHIYMLPYISPPVARELFECEINSYEDAVKKLLDTVELDKSAINILLTHQFYTNKRSDYETLPEGSEITVVGGLDDIHASILAKFDYAALGHIHRMCNVRGERIRYAGTPLKYSVNESKKYLNLVELDKDEIDVKTVGLPYLRDVREIEGTFEELVKSEMATEDYVSIRLKSETGITGVKKRLLEYYPNLLNVIYEHNEASEEDFYASQKIIQEQPLEMLESFFSSRGYSLDKTQRELAERILEELKE